MLHIWLEEKSLMWVMVFNKISCSSWMRKVRANRLPCKRLGLVGRGMLVLPVAVKMHLMMIALHQILNNKQKNHLMPSTVQKRLPGPKEEVFQKWAKRNRLVVYHHNSLLKRSKKGWSVFMSIINVLLLVLSSSWRSTWEAPRTSGKMVTS